MFYKMQTMVGWRAKQHFLTFLAVFSLLAAFLALGLCRVVRTTRDPAAGERTVSRPPME
jgi:hypothetical protein